MEENNFFGFVSKIGSLITNNKPKEIKKIKPVEKKYNIKISSDIEEEKEIDNIDNPDDEEEEEEDDEDTKEMEEEKKIREEKEKIEKEEKNKIQNLVLDIIKDNDNKEKEEHKNNDIDEEKIDEDDENKINNIKDKSKPNNIYNSEKDNNYPQNKSSSFPFMNENNEINDIFIYDENFSCHMMLKKGNNININDFIIFPILFLEKQKSLFYKMGMINNPSYEPKNYIFFLDEHYLYFAKDEIIQEEMDENTRRITKIVSLFDIKDFFNDHNDEHFIIKLTIKKEMKSEKIFRFYIDQKYFTEFIKLFNLKLNIYGIDFLRGRKEII